MVFFTVFATIDSLTLLLAMTGMVGGSLGTLKAIADLEHDLLNSTEFLSQMRLLLKVEHGFILLNIAACTPFLFNWWMAPPQALFAFFKFVRLLLGWHKIEEKEAFKKNVYLHHRTVHTLSLFFYLISWFIYFARSVTAIMDIHIHGISPYD
mmetsp:Transcript_121777/g.351604  ORF Transcript_121777/g.351604 Transcript_121777/m.351604 type:complete len:152 (-) Transcript_121777:69-524(-)